MSEKIQTFTLDDKSGMKIKVTNVGCAVMSVNIPTRVGDKDIVAGFETPEEYLNPHPSFGVICGRVANRIGKGKFELDGVTYQLEKNLNGQHLHGGSNGFDKKIWEVLSSDDTKVVFRHVSPDGDSGYPGELTSVVTYSLQNKIFRIDYELSTDSKTIANLTNHSYFNLCGHDAPNVYAQEVQIFADKITACNEYSVPTGDFIPVEGTVFDFLKTKTIGPDVDSPELSGTLGYDHNYCLNKEGIAAVAYSPWTNVKLTVKTDSPGIQFYTANNLDKSNFGKGIHYSKHSSFCLETQFYPDSINHPHFPSCVVEKDKPLKHYTTFEFEW